MQLQQHLNIQHHELIKQLKLMQRQYLLSQGFVKPMESEFQSALHNIMPSSYFHNVMATGEDYDKEEMTFKQAQFEAHNRHEQSLHVQLQAIQRNNANYDREEEDQSKDLDSYLRRDNSDLPTSIDYDDNTKHPFRTQAVKTNCMQQNFDLYQNNALIKNDTEEPVNDDSKLNVKRDADDRADDDADNRNSPELYSVHKMEVNNNQNALTLTTGEHNEHTRSPREFRMAKSQLFEGPDEAIPPCSKESDCVGMGTGVFHCEKSSSLNELSKPDTQVKTSSLGGSDSPDRKSLHIEHEKPPNSNTLQELVTADPNANANSTVVARKLKATSSSRSSSSKRAYRCSIKDTHDRSKTPTDDYIPISPNSSASTTDTQAPLLALLPTQLLGESTIKMQQTGDTANDPNSQYHSKLSMHGNTKLNAFSIGENASGGSNFETAGGPGFIDNNTIRTLLDNADTKKSFQHPLYSHGVCRWPGCELVLDDIDAFASHLNMEHSLDDRSTAQARVQMQVVSQLELHLQKERDRLQAMMHHLYLTKQFLGPEKMECKESMSSPFLSIPPCSSPNMASGISNQSQAAPITLNSQLLNLNTANISAFRKRITDKSPLTLAGGLPYMLERAGLDVQQEIQRNREFYKNADVRPPFTYASLIRQSIIESPDKQLTLNEIYNWFQNTFCYFRRNAATWKNAIRTNLSLHKCFVRYEDDFGSFWMVDDSEFIKRRHLSRGRPRKYEPSSSPNLTGPHCSDAANSQNAAAGNITGGSGSGAGSGEPQKHKKCQNEKATNGTGTKNLSNYLNRTNMNQCSSAGYCKNSCHDSSMGAFNLNMQIDGGIDGIDICEDGQRKLSYERNESKKNAPNTNDTDAVCIDIGINPDGDNINIGHGLGAAFNGFGVNSINGFLSNNYHTQNTSFDPLPNSPPYGNGNFSAHLQNVWTCAPPILEDGASLSINSHIARHTFESFRNCTRGLINQSRSAERDFSMTQPYYQDHHQQQNLNYKMLSTTNLTRASFLANQRCRNTILNMDQRDNRRQFHIVDLIDDKSDFMYIGQEDANKNELEFVYKSPPPNHYDAKAASERNAQPHNEQQQFHQQQHDEAVKKKNSFFF